MHELGIVTYVAKSVDEIAEQNNVNEIESVILSIGEVSGVIPEYLVDCWNYFKVKYPRLSNSKLDYEITPAVTFCNSCETEYSTLENGKVCPECGSEDTWLLRGNTCDIKEINVIE